MSSTQYYRRASKQKSGTTLSSLLQPITGYFSSFFAAESATDPQPTQDLARGWPTTEQQYDGLWTLHDDDVQQLTGKSLTHFSSSVLDAIGKVNRHVAVTTAIVIALLEKRCAASRTLWQVISNKARQRLGELLGGDPTQVQQLIQDIQNQLI